MMKAVIRSLAVTCSATLWLLTATGHAQTVCNLSGQQGGSFIGGGTTPFTVNGTGKSNCRALSKPDATAMLEFGPTLGDNTAHCPGANVYEYPLVNGSFVMSQANSGSASGTPTTTVSGTFAGGSSYSCFNFNTTPTTTNGFLVATVIGGTGKWAGASGSFTVVASGRVLQSFGSGIVQQDFTATLSGTIQHP